jgi:hypothetical protein
LGKFQKNKKVSFSGEFIYYNQKKKQGIFATGYISFLKNIFFTKMAKISSPQKEEEDCKQVPMDDRPFGYKPKKKSFRKKTGKNRCDSYLLPTSPTHYLPGFFN